MKIRYTNEDEFGYYELIKKFNKFTHFELISELDSLKFNSYKEKFEYLRKIVFTDFKRQIHLFYILLGEYGYNFKYDICDAIKELNNAHSIEEIFRVIEFYQNSMIIDKIKYENGVFSIISGNDVYNFSSLSKYEITDIKELNTCIFSPFYATLDKVFYEDGNGNIIDFDSNIVMDETTFINLYQPTIANTRKIAA